MRCMGLYDDEDGEGEACVVDNDVLCLWDTGAHCSMMLSGLLNQDIPNLVVIIDWIA
jgi:hypothetical protein